VYLFIIVDVVEEPYTAMEHQEVGKTVEETTQDISGRYAIPTM
jgi:hypothetical protein